MRIWVKGCTKNGQHSGRAASISCAILRGPITAMRQLIADAGHQLPTLITVVCGFIAILLRGTLREVDDLDPILDSMNRQCVEIGTPIDKLIFARRVAR